MSDSMLQRSLNRRSLFQVSGAFALLVGLNGTRGFLVSPGLTRRRSIADLHFADFEPLLGQSFSVFATSALPFLVTLDAVKNSMSAATAATNPRHEWFSLAFTGPKGQTFSQGTYPFAHPLLGHFDLFVVPAMAVEHEERHIAIINRI